MNKQQLSEALAESDPKKVDWGVVLAAARLVERLLPGVCENCDGTGGLWDGGEEMPLYSTCLFCHGSGQVWDEGIVEAVAAAIVAEYRKGRGDTRVKEMARAVLSAIAQLTEVGSQ